MKKLIGVIYKSGYFESHMKFPDGTIWKTEHVSFLHSNGKRLLLITETGHYNDGQCSSKTKNLFIYDIDGSIPVKVELKDNDCFHVEVEL